MKESRTVVVIVLLTLAILISLCLGVGYFGFVQFQQAEQRTLQVIEGTATRLAQRTAIAESTRQAAQATLSAEANWPLVLSDDFESDLNVHDWPVGHHEDPSLRAERQITDGVYRFQVTAKDGFSWYASPRGDPVSDFYVVVDAKSKGRNTGAYGVVFRQANGDNYYQFLIEDDQFFSVSLRYGGKWITLMGRRESSAIRVGEVNRLGVSAEGSHLSFWINGQFVAHLEDTHLESGQTGVALELYSAGDRGIFEFDNFQVRAPQTQMAQSAPATRTSAQLMPTGTPATQTPVPTLAPVSTAAVQAAQATLTAQSKWLLVMNDSFDSSLNLNKWTVGRFGNAFSHGEWRLTDGIYRLEVKAQGAASGNASPRIASESNFYVSVDAKHASGTLMASYGVFFRFVSNNNYYRFLIRDDQHFSFSRVEQGESKNLIAWSESQAIRPGETNRITVSAEGSHFMFFINRVYVAEYQDSTFASGLLGLAYQLDHADDEAVIEFDNFELRAPPMLSSEPSATRVQPIPVTATATPRGTPNSQD